MFDESNDMMIYCKIDVEGFEESVIRTLISSKIISKVHEIYYEVDEEWIDKMSIRELFTYIEIYEIKSQEYKSMNKFLLFSW